jgi:hypothetical protein
MGRAGRVHVAIIGGVQRADHAIEIVERVQLADKIRSDQLDVEAQRTPDRQGLAQPVHLVFGVGEAERAAAVPGAGLAGLSLQLSGIEPDIVVDALAQP